MTKQINALKVFTLTPHIVAYLEEHDPKALEQARAAIMPETAAERLAVTLTEITRVLEDVKDLVEFLKLRAG